MQHIVWPTTNGSDQSHQSAADHLAMEATGAGVGRAKAGVLLRTSQRTLIVDRPASKVGGRRHRKGKGAQVAASAIRPHEPRRRQGHDRHREPGGMGHGPERKLSVGCQPPSQPFTSIRRPVNVDKRWYGHHPAAFPANSVCVSGSSAAPEAIERSMKFPSRPYVLSTLRLERIKVQGRRGGLLLLRILRRQTRCRC